MNTRILVSTRRNWWQAWPANASRLELEARVDEIYRAEQSRRRRRPTVVAVTDAGDVLASAGPTCSCSCHR